MIRYRQPFRGEYPITQQYGEVIPGVTYHGQPHTGIDYGCPQGTPILASAGGTVMAAGWDLTGYGFRVIIRHESGKATLYGHLDSISVSRNDEVEQGQEIGLSGMTGIATGPHLHFEARRQWNNYQTHFDPMTLPLISVDDAAANAAADPAGAEISEPAELTIPASSGSVCRVTCESAWVRKWDTFERFFLVHENDLVYAFPIRVIYNGLPFRYIGAGLCMAEHDAEGTRILEDYDGDKEKE